MSEWRKPEISDSLDNASIRSTWKIDSSLQHYLRHFNATVKTRAYTGDFPNW